MKNKGMPKIIEKSKRIRALKKIKEMFLKYYHPLFITNDISIMEFVLDNANRMRNEKIRALQTYYSQLAMEYEDYRKKVESNLKGS